MRKTNPNQFHLLYYLGGLFNIIMNFQWYHYWKYVPHLKVRKTYNDTKIKKTTFIFATSETSYVTFVNGAEKLLQITCEFCNKYFQCASKIIYLLGITFLHTGMTSLGLYLKRLTQEFFQLRPKWTISCIYHSIFKRCNNNLNDLKC